MIDIPSQAQGGSNAVCINKANIRMTDRAEVEGVACLELSEVLLNVHITEYTNQYIICMIIQYGSYNSPSVITSVSWTIHQKRSNKILDHFDINISCKIINWIIQR